MPIFAMPSIEGQAKVNQAADAGINAVSGFWQDLKTSWKDLNLIRYGLLLVLVGLAVFSLFKFMPKE
jgi:hypothetical protein